MKIGKKIGPRRRCRTWLALLAAASFCWASLGCGARHWIAAENSGCKLFDSHPEAGQRLRWEGACHEGRADGWGLLQVFADGVLRFRIEGNMDQGRLDGGVRFGIYREGRLVSEYEEKWLRGQRRERVRNLTLESRLAGIDDARGYLLALKRFQQAHPDAWLDALHRALGARTVFAAREIAVSEGPPDAPAPRRGKVLEHELLFKIFDGSSTPAFRYYTLYRHRPSALRDLTTGNYEPGGRQFSIAPPADALLTEDPPDALPERYAPLQAVSDAPLTFLGEAPSGHWHPLRRSLAAPPGGAGPPRSPEGLTARIRFQPGADGGGVSLTAPITAGSAGFRVAVDRRTPFGLDDWARDPLK